MLCRFFQLVLDKPQHVVVIPYRGENLSMTNKTINEQNVIYDERIPHLKTIKKTRPNKVLISFICLFFIAIIFLLYFQSSYSKLDQVYISGVSILSEEQVKRFSGVRQEMFYFNFTTDQIEKRLLAVEEIQAVEVKREWPNHLHIEIEEYPHVAFWLEDNRIFPIIGSGYILFDREWLNKPITLPLIHRWQTKEGILELSSELAKLPRSILAMISEIQLTPTSTDPYRLTLFMEDGHEVYTTIRKFSEKISLYPSLLETITEDKQGGRFYLLDATWYEEPEFIRQRAMSEVEEADVDLDEEGSHVGDE